MFGRSTKSEKAAKSANPRKYLSPSVIAEGMHVLGNIISEGMLDIDGRIDGNVRADIITLRDNGAIRGDVMADTVHIYGEVVGLIKAKNVMVYASARINGTIMHESITIEDGASVDGKFKRTEKLDFSDAELAEARRLSAPSITTFTNEAEDDEPASEAEIKILENLRLIS